MIIDILIEKSGLSIKEYLREIKFSQKLYKAVKNDGGLFLRNNLEFPNWEKLQKGDKLSLVLPQESIGKNIMPVEMPLEIIYEDSYLLVINKPNGLAVIPTTKHFNQSLANGVAYYYQQFHIESNIHFVNRLDAETTGLIMLAKSRYIHHLLTKDYKNTITRCYLAKVEGILDQKKGVVDVAIKPQPKPSIIRVVSADGSKSITHYAVIKEEENTSILTLKLETGRTHQIRVHMKHIGHPIVGDKLYGNPDQLMYLHSYQMKFYHPVTNESILIEQYPKWYEIGKD